MSKAIPLRAGQAAPKARIFAPRSGAPFGSDKKVAERLIEEAGGAKRAMALLNVGKGTLYSFADEREQAAASFIKYAQVRQLTAAGCVAAAQDLALLAGGAFIPLPRATDTLPALSAAYAREHGETMARAIEHLGDGRLDEAEARGLLEEAHEDLAKLVQLIGALTRVADGMPASAGDSAPED